jgi:hypothetical protein
MGALELSRQYYNEIAAPALMRDFPDIFDRLAVGLVGNGSERFGFDDELSRDHDWGIDFYIWVTEADQPALPALNNWKQQLFAQNPPAHAVRQSAYYLPVLPMTVASFYQQLIGVPGVPQTIAQWTRAPEEHFALAVNGAIFHDGAGQFSQIRNGLLQYYPEDIRRKRIAAACMNIAQTGQYNHLRMAARSDWFATRLALTHFCEAALHLVYMLNRVYQPYYKWAYKMLNNLPKLAVETGEPLLRLALAPGFAKPQLEQQQSDITMICDILAEELRAQGLTGSKDTFLATLGEEVQQSIKDSNLRNLPATFAL